MSTQLAELTITEREGGGSVEDKKMTVMEEYCVALESAGAERKWAEPRRPC